ncbi:hypothetical protein TRVA0_040S00870 [Trichomonascus vanleenenianus]|uniref:uncharacterized protein n=1 Tax=Trichomonascus vanleenenianus TaxID=2268995 RepID=UPI003EC9E646
MKLVDLSNFNVVSAFLGGFTLLFCLVSFTLKDRLYIAEPLPAMLFGVVFQEAHWARPRAYGDPNDISREFARLVLGIQLTLAGVQLPGKYLKQAKWSIFMLLVPVMTAMWVISALIIFLLVPGLTFLEALIIGSCITPTDPVLCASIVHGRFAEKYVSERLKNIIVGESGANDGFGYPFLFLALSIYYYSGVEIARQWIVYTIFYEILLSVAYGAVIGYLFQEIVVFGKQRGYIDRDAYYLSVFAMAIFIMGTAGLIGTDDLLACFIAGNLFTWNDRFRIDTLHDSLQPVMDLILNLGIFMWIGATMPWTSFNDVLPVWRFIVMGVCILVFRRVPAVVAFYKLIPDIGSFNEALFSGFFGPIGVGALFYLEIALREFEEQHQPPTRVLAETIGPVVYFAILSSVVVHGLSIPVIKLIMTLRKNLCGRNDKLVSYATEGSASIRIQVEEVTEDDEPPQLPEATAVNFATQAKALTPSRTL